MVQNKLQIYPKNQFTSVKQNRSRHAFRPTLGKAEEIGNLIF